MKKYLLPFIIAFSALSVSASAAFYSVSGLSKLFAGASLQVIIMAGSLEIAKLVTASLLYQYWDKINKLLKIYLTIACVILMFITSAGIYGFLSGAYQSTYSQSEIVGKELAVIEMKRERFEEKRTELRDEKSQLVTSVKDLRIALSNPTQVQYIDRETGQLITTTSSSARRALQKELEASVNDRDAISIKLEAITDSISKLDIAVLDKEINNEAERELGPLKYISDLTGKPMSKVINWLLLMIIFVFDPLAISLVVAANFAFSQITPKIDPKNYKIYKDPKSLKKGTIQNVKGEYKIIDPQPTPQPQKPKNPTKKPTTKPKPTTRKKPPKPKPKKNILTAKKSTRPKKTVSKKKPLKDKEKFKNEIHEVQVHLNRIKDSDDKIKHIRDYITHKRRNGVILPENFHSFFD